MQRTIIIGDRHGCYDEAVTLLDRLAVTEQDRVIFAGDLVDRGPKPRECVDLAMKHECVLGNHEEKHLRDTSDHHPETRRALVREPLRGVGSQASLSAEHYAY